MRSLRWHPGKQARNAVRLALREINAVNAARLPEYAQIEENIMAANGSWTRLDGFFFRDIPTPDRG